MKNIDFDNDDDESLEDLIKQVQDLEDIFGDEEPNYQAIIDEFGIDIEELERDMARYEQKVTVNFSTTNEEVKDPEYAYITDSGFDLYSTEEININRFGRTLISTGLHIDIPQHYELQIRSKSGLAINEGLMVLNSPGTVDQGYTGEIKVIVFNTNDNPVTIKKGQKIAQAVFAPVVCGRWIQFNKVEKIEDKDRSINGFGSTGK
jgi:dUTP pyrophosphatase